MRAVRYTWGLLALARSLHGQSLPYNPSYVLRTANSSTAYIFQPVSASSSQFELLSIDLTQTLDASDLLTDTLTDTLPFLKDGETMPFTPSMEADGSISVLTGKCAEGASGAQVWRYASESEDGSGDYTWRQSTTTVQGSDVTGSDYLAAGLTFSDTIDGGADDSRIYIFGGMCPTGQSTAADWQSNAEYSSSMLQLTPKDSGYDIGLISTRGPPISQAGVSVVPLPATYSTDSNGAPLGQQQDFVLLAGHTQAAFINTSQVALFSLPQQSWSFVPVEQPSTAKTDLAMKRSVPEVTPRSGHTAVLAEDGKSIIMFGGWVGDVSTPADPQLAVLELGAGYGGIGEWKWTIPEAPSDGLSGSGLFGHGAAMLPGGVMMVVGGYRIPGSPSKLFRRNTLTSNDKVLFYNTTGQTWISSYTPPAKANHQSHSNGPLGSTGEKIGLGAGLGIGAAFLASIVIFYFWYTKRLQRAREEREQTLITHSSDGSLIGHMDQPFLDRGGIDGRGGDAYAMAEPWSTGGQANSQVPRPPPMRHATGMFVNVPSPTRGLRKSVAGRNYQYHAAPRFDDNRMRRANNNIHPIAEQENEDGSDFGDNASRRDNLSDAEDKLREVERMLNGDDPFTDPVPDPLGSHPVAPGDTVKRIPTSASNLVVPKRKPVPVTDEMPNWVEILPGEETEESNRRDSPTIPDERTSSTLSEQSQHSTISTSSITRTMSTRTGAILAAAAASYRQSRGRPDSPTKGRSMTASTDRASIVSSLSARERSSTTGSMTPGGLSGIADDEELNQTRSPTFTQLQSESDLLLGGAPTMDRDDPFQRAMAANTSRSRSIGNRLPPPVVPTQRRLPGIIGSLRRALNVMSVAERSFSLTSEPYKDGPKSASSSPNKTRPQKPGNEPRRSVSDGGALLQHKRGEKDWTEKQWPPYRDDPDPGDWGEPRTSEDKRQAEEDWDVEGAASNRDFQVMFSIPKSRLRVVNDDMDRASLRSASDGAVSRNGSVKTLTREESMKALRARAEGERAKLPSTEEEKEEFEKVKAA